MMGETDKYYHDQYQDRNNNDRLKLETDIITSIGVNSIGQTVMLVIRCVETFKTDVTTFIGYFNHVFDITLTD